MPIIPTVKRMAAQAPAKAKVEKRHEPLSSYIRSHTFQSHTVKRLQ